MTNTGMANQLIELLIANGFEAKINSEHQEYPDFIEISKDGFKADEICLHGLQFTKKWGAKEEFEAISKDMNSKLEAFNSEAKITESELIESYYA